MDGSPRGVFITTNNVWHMIVNWYEWLHCKAR